MKKHDKNESDTMTLVKAIETLSNIADLEVDYEVAIAETHDLTVQDYPLSYRSVNWLHEKNAEVTVGVVKDTFRVILNYLSDFYKKEYHTINHEQTIEGIKTIMVLVGEAAKKLDKCSKAFHKVHSVSVTEFDEYKKLQEFYLSRIARKIDEGVLGKWVLALSSRIYSNKNVKLQGRKSSQTKHVFVDLEAVKNDTEYDLFFLRKEDGTRFFSPRLIRNVKLVSDFGGYFGDVQEADPLVDIALWQDRFTSMAAKNIVEAMHSQIDKFYHEAMHHKDNECIEVLSKAIMALMLCCNSHNLMHGLPVKSCRDYFCDFQLFLRKCLHLNEYQKMIAYPPEKSSKLANRLLDTVHGLSLILYKEVSAMQSLLSPVHLLIEEAASERSSEHRKKGNKQTELWDGLAGDYAAMTALIKHHPNGPLNKILDALEEGALRQFDPLAQNNIPSQLFSLYLQERKIMFQRMPTPTSQGFIHKASVVEEFKGFLRAYEHDSTIKKCLLFNFQDRTSWKEYYRCKAIEDLSNHESFTRHINVVTLSKDTEFYHQLAPYHDENHANVFIKNFKKQLVDEKFGNYFPKSMKKELVETFFDPALKAVHRVFFSGKNILLREHRMDFIEIFYLSLELKILEISKAEIVGFTCKDSIDTAEAAGIELFVFLKLLSQEHLSESDREQLDLMIYGPSLLFRERLMLPERFNRMVSLVKAIESVRYHEGKKEFTKHVQEVFGKLYITPILGSKVIVERPKEPLG